MAERSENNSFLWCAERSCLCTRIDNPDRVCERAICYHDDPDYLAEQARREKRYQENVRRAKEEAEEDAIKNKIGKIESLIWQAYRKGRINEAEALTKELMKFNAELRKIRG